MEKRSKEAFLTIAIVILFYVTMIALSPPTYADQSGSIYSKQSIVVGPNSVGYDTFSQDLPLGASVNVYGTITTSSSVEFYLLDKTNVLQLAANHTFQTLITQGVNGSYNFDTWLTHGGKWYVYFDNRLGSSPILVNYSYRIDTYQKPLLVYIIIIGALIAAMIYLIRKR